MPPLKPAQREAQCPAARSRSTAVPTLPCNCPMLAPYTHTHTHRRHNTPHPVPGRSIWLIRRRRHQPTPIRQCVVSLNSHDRWLSAVKGCFSFGGGGVSCQPRKSL
eukprot:7147988-Prymnesium_polylepis.1